MYPVLPERISISLQWYDKHQVGDSTKSTRRSPVPLWLGPCCKRARHPRTRRQRCTWRERCGLVTKWMSTGCLDEGNPLKLPENQWCFFVVGEIHMKKNMPKLRMLCVCVCVCVCLGLRELAYLLRWIEWLGGWMFCTATGTVTALI